MPPPPPSSTFSFPFPPFARFFFAGAYVPTPHVMTYEEPWDSLRSLNSDPFLSRVLCFSFTKQSAF